MQSISKIAKPTLSLAHIPGVSVGYCQCYHLALSRFMDHDIAVIAFANNAVSLFLARGWDNIPYKSPSISFSLHISVPLYPSHSFKIRPAGFETKSTTRYSLFV